MFQQYLISHSCEHSLLEQAVGLCNHAYICELCGALATGDRLSNVDAFICFVCSRRKEAQAGADPFADLRSWFLDLQLDRAIYYRNVEIDFDGQDDSQTQAAAAD